MRRIDEFQFLEKAQAVSTLFPKKVFKKLALAKLNQNTTRKNGKCNEKKFVDITSSNLSQYNVLLHY